MDKLQFTLKLAFLDTRAKLCMHVLLGAHARVAKDMLVQLL